MEEITEEQIYRTWTGKNDEFYHKAERKKFNFCAFFFGVVYILYRRMYLLGISYMIISFLLRILCSFFGMVGDIVYYTYALATWIVLGCNFYSIYEWNFKRKMNKYKNLDYTNEELLKVAKQKGGVSWTPVIFLVIIPICIYCVLIVIGTSLTIFEVAQNTPLQGAENQTNNTIGQSNINYYGETSLSNNNNATVVLEKNEYSMKYNTNTWKEEPKLENSSLPKAFVTKDDNGMTMFAYGGSKYINKSQLDCSNYSSIKNATNSLLEEIKPTLDLENIEMGNVYVYSKNNIYYYEFSIKQNGMVGKEYIVLEPQKNKMLVFVAVTKNSYIDYTLSSQIVDTITKIEVQ